MNDPLSEALEAEVLAQELTRFAAWLRQSNEEPPRISPAKDHSDKHQRPTNSTCLPLAQRMYRARRARDRYLPSELFGEPAWDLLLDLYSAQVEGLEINVTSACIASSVPDSTALRYIAALEQHRLVGRYNHPQDKRVHFLRLTAYGFRCMHRFFTRLETEPLGFVADASNGEIVASIL